jgi:exopolysaccharide biosynthesis polyprenyl glycosylphosphotransferase
LARIKRLLDRRPVSQGVQVGPIEARSVPAIEELVSRPGAHALDARFVAEAGRALLIWLPVFLICANTFSSLVVAGALATLLAVVWLLALRSAFAAVHFAFGVPIRVGVGTVTGLIAVSALTFWLPGPPLPPSRLVAITVSVFGLSAAWEAVCQRVIARKRRVLIVGTGSCATDVVEAVERCDGGMPFSVVGTVADDRAAEPARGTPVLGNVGELSQVVEAVRPDVIVLADVEGYELALNRLLDAPFGGFKVADVAHFFEYAFARVPLHYLAPSWFMSILHLRQRPYSRVAKRTFDLLVAGVGLLLAAPLMAVTALLVRLTPGPVIYRQTRVGQAGQPFTMYKFRTMRVDAEGDGQPIFAAERDPRTTGVGRLLRKTHLDELPQLWDVVKGDMSIVGPRPERPEFVPMLEEAVPFFTRRLLIKPGITGWAQLRSDYAWDCESAAEKLSYDLWYLRHRNVMLDLAICAKTFTSLLIRPGR